MCALDTLPIGLTLVT